MIKVLIFSVILSLLSVKAQAYTILVWGDSLSAAYRIPVEQGWVALLKQRLAGDIEVINRSISAQTTAGGKANMPKSITDIDPDLVILELGANDGLRGLNLDEMKQNLATMIQLSQNSDAEVLLLGMKIPPNYGSTYTGLFHATYQDLAAQYNIPLVPFFIAPVALNEALMQRDRLHPTAAAQSKILEHVWQTLAPLLPN